MAIDSELRMAMFVALRCWSGTSLIEGAIAIMQDVRRTHPAQFCEGETGKQDG